MPLHRERISGNILSGFARDCPAFEITHGDWLKRSSRAFRDHVGDGPGGAKKLASALECSDKTTKSWLDGKTAPSGILNLRAMNRIPAYAALQREIAAMQSDMDPRLQSKIAELHRMTLALARET